MIMLFFKRRRAKKVFDNFELWMKIQNENLGPNTRKVLDDYRKEKKKLDKITVF
jgi:hypothetical protein